MSRVLPLHLIPVVALLGGVAQAQEATLFPGDAGFEQQSAARRAVDGEPQLGRVTIIGSRELMRQEVQAELAAALRDGSFDRSGEARMIVYVPWNSTLTREAVLAEAARARANGTFDTSGEYWHGQDRLTRTAAAADRALVARSSEPAPGAVPHGRISR